MLISHSCRDLFYGTAATLHLESYESLNYDSQSGAWVRRSKNISEERNQIPFVSALILVLERSLLIPERDGISPHQYGVN
jgi:hypothetical protein